MSLPVSPLRYPGSKRRLSSYIEQTLRVNRFSPTLYIELFVGGASVALHLLRQKLVTKIILVDRDPWIASFWQTVFWDTEWLIYQIERTPVTVDTWQALKESQPETCREKAWACLFLNRTSFSGILRREVGPLGGRTQTSPYKIDCRFPRQTLIDRIRQIASFRDCVYSVWEMPWNEALDRIRIEQYNGKLPQSGLFFYLDPPFFEKADTLYRYYFTQNDHESLRDVLLLLEDKWLLSYDSANQVESLYSQAIANNSNGTKKSSVEIFYSVSSLRERKRGKEIILTNLEILPDLWEGYEQEVF